MYLNLSARRAILGPLGMAVALSVGLVGCGKPAAPPSADGSAPAAASKEGSSKDGDGASKAASAPKKNAARNEVYTDASGKKWIGPIPYDAFFDNPLQVASNASKVATAAPAGDGGAKAKPAGDGDKPADKTDAAAKPTAPAPAASGGDWASLLAGKDIEDELKEIRNRTAAGLTGVGQYNAKYPDIKSDGAVVAAMAVIAQKHPDNVSWKERAKFIRDYGAAMSKGAAGGLGAKAYKPTQEAFEKLTTVLDGNTPSDADVPEEANLIEKADRKALMKRMERAKDWMLKEMTTESKYKAEINKVAHEAAILGALTQAQMQPGYDNIDDDGYKKYVKEMLDAAAQIRKSIEAQDFKLFEQGVNNVQKTCNGCHSDFVGGA